MSGVERSPVFATVGRVLPDRIRVLGVLLVACFVAVLLLRSQSAASYPTYLLGLLMLVSVRQWSDAFRDPLVWLVGVLLCYLALSSLWSDPFDGRAAVSVATRGLLVFCFVIALAECQLRGEVQRWLSRAMALVGAAATLAAILVFLAEDPPTDA